MLFQLGNAKFGRFYTILAIRLISINCMQGSIFYQTFSDPQMGMQRTEVYTVCWDSKDRITSIHKSSRERGQHIGKITFLGRAEWTSEVPHIHGKPQCFEVSRYVDFDIECVRPDTDTRFAYRLDRFLQVWNGVLEHRSVFR